MGLSVHTRPDHEWMADGPSIDERRVATICAADGDFPWNRFPLNRECARASAPALRRLRHGRHGDGRHRFMLGVNFCPTGETAFKLDHFHEWQRDAFNLEARSVAMLFSTASYF